MNAYQNFLDFFTLHNKERLDGIGEEYFSAMSREERARAFDYMLELLHRGGGEEIINGMFRADSTRAVEPVARLLDSGYLKGVAKVSAAWNLSKIYGAEHYRNVFIECMHDPDEEVREKAAYFVSARDPHHDINFALKRMIRTETGLLPRIHAVDKLLMRHGVSKEVVGKNEFSEIYKALHDDNIESKEFAFEKLSEKYPVGNFKGDLN